MNKFKRGWTLLGFAVAILVRVSCAQVATTTVHDTVYRADGTPAGGSVVIGWSAFTTSSGSAVASGSTSVTLASGGLLNVTLAPNAGATPMGSYYTAVYHLDDGSTSREYWVVPVTVPGGGPAKLAAIRNSVLPQSVAMQTVSKGYVDTAIAAAVTGHPLDSTPYVLKAGDTMTGPLVLPADPVNDTQAADKHYVDVGDASVAAGLGRKVDELPGTTQVVAQPTATQLEVNNLNGALYASQYANGGSGIAGALASTDCASGCDVEVENTYPTTEGVNTTSMPSKAMIIDKRGGSVEETTYNPSNPTEAGSSFAQTLTVIDTLSTPAKRSVYPGAEIIQNTGLRISNTALAGGSNQFPEAVEAPPYFKTTYSATSMNGTYYTLGQHVLNQNVTRCYGVGDCLMGSQVMRASGGSRDSADEGAHPYDLDYAEDDAVYRGTCATGCTTGSTTLTVTATNDGGTQGEGRFLIDKNPAKTITAGILVGGGQGTPFAKAEFSGTSFAPSVFLSAATAATSQTNDIAPGMVSVSIATTGVPSGFATNTAALSSGSGVACIADPHPLGASTISNFETANYTVIDGTHLQLTLNKVHGVGAVIAIGGLCGYGLEESVDNILPVRQVFSVIGSTSATELYYDDLHTPIVGIPGLTSAYQNFRGTIASISRAGNLTTVALTGNLPDVSGLTVTVAGVADPSYNGNFVVTSTGPRTLTYPNSGPDSSSSGGTLGMTTGAFVLYPMAEVLAVMDPTAKAVNGYFRLAANTAPWAAGDSVEEPHYFQEIVTGDLAVITQFTPRPSISTKSGIAYAGNVGPGMHGWSIQNVVPASKYLGNGGLHALPDAAYEAVGPWNTVLSAQAGNVSVFSISCNTHGCNNYDSAYALFALNSANGVDQLTYQPQTSTAIWGLGGAIYSFSPTSFNASTINVGTLNANTISGAISGSSITSGTISAARLPAFGPSGSSHSAGIVPDPGATAGTSRFLREDGTFAVPPGTGGGGGGGGVPTIAVGAAAGTGASAAVSGNNVNGVISVTTGTGTTASATLATMTFNGTLSSAPQGCTLMSRNANAAAQIAMIYTTAPSTTAWTIAVAGGAIPASVSSYQWSYQCN